MEIPSDNAYTALSQNQISGSTLNQEYFQLVDKLENSEKATLNINKPYSRAYSVSGSIRIFD